MVATESTMLPLGTQAPDFALPDAVSGRTVRLADFEGAPGLLVMFICNHCPYVIHVRDELTRIANDYAPRGLAIVAINSNDIDKYPQDAPPKMKALAEELGWTFPFCMDETQEVAKAYRAACTPDFFVFDRRQRLFYRGQLDPARPGNPIPVTGRDLRDALDRVLAGDDPPDIQLPSMGCNIKWKPGNAPPYFG